MKLPVDNTSLSIIASCQRRYQLEVLQGLTSPRNREAQFGDSYHKCLEHIDKGVEPATVVNDVFAEAPTVDKAKMLKTLIQFKLSNKMPEPVVDVATGKPMIEYKFSIHYYTQYEALDENIEVYLEGTIDRVDIEVSKNLLRVIDYKTGVGATDYQVEKTKREYAMAFQLAFYLHALIKGPFLAPGMERYLDFVQSKHYSLQIWMAFYNMGEPFHKVIRSAFNDEFLNNVIPNLIDLRIGQMIEVVRLNNNGLKAPYSGMNVYNACSLCQFRPACLVAGTAREEELLSRYEKRIYNPLNFR